MGPELGFTHPGKTIVCGDSHTSTHGAFGALAFGIGTSEVEHVMATQTLWQQAKTKTLEVKVNHKRVNPKDVILGTLLRSTAQGLQQVMLLSILEKLFAILRWKNV